MTTKSRFAGTFIGLAVGDAMGVPLEGLEQLDGKFINEPIGGGPYNLPPGAWTDKTATALCLAQSLLVTNELDVYDLVARLNRWVENGENSSTGCCVGLEPRLSEFLNNFKRTKQMKMQFASQSSSGSAVLPRVAPIACIHWSDLSIVSRMARELCYLTHASEEVASACEHLALTLSHLIAGRSWSYSSNLLSEQNWSSQVKHSPTANWKNKDKNDLEFNDDALSLLETSFWCVANSKSFSPLLQLLTWCSNTLGATVGQIAGALYGLESIPIRWFDQLFCIDKLTDIALEMVQLSRSEEGMRNLTVLTGD